MLLKIHSSYVQRGKALLTAETEFHSFEKKSMKSVGAFPSWSHENIQGPHTLLFFSIRKIQEAQKKKRTHNWMG
jgi:hypothetical protein